MARPRAAIVHIETVSLNCPECDEPVTAPGGSYLLTLEEYESIGSIATCRHCKTRYTRPVLTMSANRPEQPRKRRKTADRVH